MIDFITVNMDIKDLKNEGKNKEANQKMIKSLINVLNALTEYRFTTGEFQRYYTVQFGVFSTLVWWFIYFKFN